MTYPKDQIAWPANLATDIAVPTMPTDVMRSELFAACEKTIRIIVAAVNECVS